MYSGCLEDWYTSLGDQTQMSKTQLFSSFFYVEVAINNFTMHLIILK